MCGRDMPALLRLKLSQVFQRKFMKGTHEFEAPSKEQLDWKVSQEGELDQNSVFHALLQARDSDTGKGLTTEELVTEAGVFIVAGTDTIAASLTSTIFYLFHYPLAFSVSFMKSGRRLGIRGHSPRTTIDIVLISLCLHRRSYPTFSGSRCSPFKRDIERGASG